MRYSLTPSSSPACTPAPAGAQAAPRARRLSPTLLALLLLPTVVVAQTNRLTVPYRAVGAAQHPGANTGPAYRAAGVPAGPRSLARTAALAPWRYGLPLPM